MSRGWHRFRLDRPVAAFCGEKPPVSGDQLAWTRSTWVLRRDRSRECPERHALEGRSFEDRANGLRRVTTQGAFHLTILRLEAHGVLRVAGAATDGLGNPMLVSLNRTTPFSPSPRDT